MQTQKVNNITLTENVFTLLTNINNHNANVIVEEMIELANNISSNNIIVDFKNITIANSVSVSVLLVLKKHLKKEIVIKNSTKELQQIANFANVHDFFVIQ